MTTLLLLMMMAFISSALTSVAGVGGGVLLISLLPLLLPVSVVVPVHGAVQISSNVSRAAFDYSAIHWSCCFPFFIGSLLGLALASNYVLAFPSDYLPIVLASFILIVVWFPIGKFVVRIPGRYLSVGAVQTFLSLFVGIAGPLSASLLLADGLRKDSYIVTGAFMASLVHIFKVITFAFLGFAYHEYLIPIAGMILMSLLGTWAGRRFRAGVPEEKFRILTKYLITFLATLMIVNSA